MAAAKTIKVENLEKAFESFEETLNGQKTSNLHALRKESLQRVVENGLPTNKSEEYKYTNIARQFSQKFDFSTSSISEEVLNEEIQTLIETHGDSNRLVFVNGQFSKTHSNLVEEDKIQIMDLETGYKKYPEVIEKHFNQVIKDLQDGFSDLNTSFAHSGAFIQVAKSTVVEKPVILYFIKDTSNGTVVTSPRNLFLVGENSQVKITEFFHTVGENESFTNTVTELKLDKNSVVDHYKIEPDRAAAYHVGNTNILQADHSVLNSVTITLGGTMIRNNLSIALDGEYCESNMYGLTILRDNQHVDNHTTVDHMQPNSYSNELYKNILDDTSTGVFNGKIFVRQYAQKTNAFQSNRNILLSEDASINTKPQLEIWADDVKCSHGATTGQIDQEQLFYLRARGLSEESARAMLLYAFAIDVLDNIKVDSIRNSLDEIISERLHKNF